MTNAMEEFMKKVTEELQVFSSKLSKYESQYVNEHVKNAGPAVAAAVGTSVAGNQQETELMFLKTSFNNLQKLVEGFHNQLEEVAQKQDDQEQYGRSNCLIVHKCEDIPKSGEYLEHEKYICNKLNNTLPLETPLSVADIDVAHPLPSKKKRERDANDSQIPAAYPA